MIRFRVLGTTELRRGDQTLDAILAGPKRVGLLAYLVLARPRGFHRRDEILPLLWPNRGQDAARNALSNLLHHVRTALGEGVIATRGVEEIGVDRDRLWCDALAFEAALDEERPRDAQSLYQGALLSGFHLPGAAPAFDQWLSQERERLRRRYRAALDTLAEQAEDRGAPAEAAEWWRQRAEDDPFDSEVVRRLMEAHVAAGNQAAALRAAQAHAERLEDEFGVPPDERVRELRDALQTRTDDERAPQPGGPRAVAASSGARETSAPPDSRSIAVLPLEALGEEAASLAQGIYGDLVTKLSAASALQVRSRTSVHGLLDTDRTAAELAAALGVRWVVEGEVQTAGGQVRINVRLVNPRTDQQAWAGDYQRALTAENLFDIQSDVTKRIAEALEAELTSEEQTRIERRPTHDLSAYRLYARGRAGVDERTEAGIRRGLECFRRALAADDEYALAWTGLADALSLLEFYGHDPPDEVPSAMEAARRAVELAPELGEAHTSLGILRSIHHDGPAALRALSRAVERAPSHAEAHIWLGWTRLCLGRPEAGLGPAERAVELDPLAPAFHAYLAEIALANGREEQALEAARRARDIQPAYGLAHYLEGLVLHHQGRPVAATSACQQALSVAPPRGTPTHAEIRAALAVTHATTGDHERAEELWGAIDEARHPFSAGLVRAALGDGAAALEAFEQVGDWGSFDTEHARYFFPDVLGPLRGTAHYDSLLRAVNESWGLEPDGTLPTEPGSPSG